MLTQFENQLADFLSNNAQVRNIDFHFENAGGGFHISPQGFARVANAIRQRRIHVCTGVSFPGTVAGVYSQGSNRFRLSPTTFPTAVNQRGYIVHEAVHALVDLSNCVATTRLSDEASAYLAQIIFLFQNGIHSHPLSQYTAAYNLAKDSGIIDPFTGAVRPGVRLGWQQYEPLRQAIQSSPVYSTVGWLAPTFAAGANGVPLTPQHACTL